MIVVEGIPKDVERAMGRAKRVRALWPVSVDKRDVGEYRAVLLEGSDAEIALFGGRNIDLECKVIETEPFLRLAFVSVGAFKPESKPETASAT